MAALRLEASPPRQWAALCALLAALCASGSLAQGADAAGLSGAVSPPVHIEAQALRGSVAGTAVAEGAVELRRGPLLLRADRLTYRPDDETADAEGRVVLSQDGNVFRGPRLTVQIPKLEGVFLEPEFDLSRSGAGGRAERIDFQGSSRFQARGPMYTGCPRDGSGDPDWLITARHLRVDLEANEAVAEGAVLRFLGVPVLALPWLTFPATRERKSGWLAPTLRIDNRSGIEIGVPWYWNIAPDRDATLTPRHTAKRGAGLEAQFRSLGPAHAGQIELDLTPYDAQSGRSRHALRLDHTASGPAATQLDIAATRASDDDWWKDHRRDILGLTPRLLSSHVGLQGPLPWREGQVWAYGRLQRWQTLQPIDDPFASPYQRAVQLGLRAAAPIGPSLEWTAEAEFNRFTLPDTWVGGGRPTGQRLHLLGDVAWPWRGPGGWLVPRLALNAAAYELDQAGSDGRRRFDRAIPTFSLDAGWTLERDARVGNRGVTQTLEPRLVYAYTPWRDQRADIAFDSASRDFTFDSIFATGDFSGVDRVSDANHLNAGAVTRFLDAERGNELLRLALVQRFLFANQRITPTGVPFTGRLSDLFALGAFRAIPDWSLEGSVRWNTDLEQAVRSVVTARYVPGAGRSIGLTQRFTGGESRQWELSWQWPLHRGRDAADEAAGTCRRRWSTGGALNYSGRDRQLVSSTLGLQVDAGCWSGRIGAERVAVGPSESLTRLSFQINLVGLGGVGVKGPGF
jgi:LPS-assembly protein